MRPAWLKAPILASLFTIEQSPQHINEHITRLCVPRINFDHTIGQVCEEMIQIPDDILGLILCENEHATACSHRFYRLILDGSYLLCKFRIILHGRADEVRSLSYAELYHCVFTMCLRRRRHMIHMAFNCAIRDFDPNHADVADLDGRRRARMLQDVLLYFDRTRATNAQSVAAAIHSKTTRVIHTKNMRGIYFF